MKNLVLSILAMLIFSVAFSQETLSSGNGGQQNYNTVLRLDYAGSKVQVTSKVATCDSYFEVNFGNVKDTIVKVGPLQSVLVSIPAGYTGKVKAKLDFGCSTDKGWVEMQIATPLKFLNFGTQKVSETQYYVNFETAEVDNVKEIYIKVSIDGRVFKIFRTLKPNQTKYHELIDLKEFIATGKVPTETNK
jgi:hypothetical protein